MGAGQPACWAGCSGRAGCWAGRLPGGPPSCSLRSPSNLPCSLPIAACHQVAKSSRLESSTARAPLHCPVQIDTGAEVVLTQPPLAWDRAERWVQEADVQRLTDQARVGGWVGGWSVLFLWEARAEVWPQGGQEGGRRRHLAALAHCPLLCPTLFGFTPPLDPFSLPTPTCTCTAPHRTAPHVLPPLPPTAGGGHPHGLLSRQPRLLAAALPGVPGTGALRLYWVLEGAALAPHASTAFFCRQGFSSAQHPVLPAVLSPPPKE